MTSKTATTRALDIIAATESALGEMSRADKFAVLVEMQGQPQPAPRPLCSSEQLAIAARRMDARARR